MVGSPPAGTVHTSPTLPDRPTRAAKEQAEPDPDIAAQAGASGRAIAHWERTILPDLRERIRLPCGTFCDLDLDVVLERMVAAARHMSNARDAPLGVLDRSRRERERSVTNGVQEVARRRIYPLLPGRGVLGELIANPVPPRVAKLGAHRGSYGSPGEHPTMMTFLRGPVTIGVQPLGDLYLTETTGGEEFSERNEGADQLVAGFAGWPSTTRPDTGLKSRHSELRRIMDTLDATMRAPARGR